jgi:prepilin-type N-terminal cleavage/methylation domain-containing protein
MNSGLANDGPGVPARDGRQGFSLVEVMVALVILTFGVLGLAATTMHAVRQTTLSEMTTERAAALQSVVEQLRATDYDLLAAGSDSVGLFDMSWTVTNGNRTKLVTIISTGPGLSTASGVPVVGASVADTFEYRIMER